MNSTIKKFARKTRSYNVERNYVQGGLALTPSEMMQSARQGIAISTQVLPAEQFDDGVVGKISEVPFILRRGVDVGDVVAYQDSCRAKVRKVSQSTD
ncbi:hypothetical protein [Sigmofec virus UA08Rod_5080]|uniref:Uncharacterized protein n=1 Tax=Sigmofec virus UA08Rod_5080 TaxID=2929414 RepID=A0A976R810_9VIRU|nr:hypothetical protein [Sigmofec virus UA08Rod_5080]